MKNKLQVLSLILGLSLISCTENERAKSWGGTATVELPVNQRLVTATWKEKEIWYLTRPMTDGETPTYYEFKEESSFGIVEGKVIFKESRK